MFLLSYDVFGHVFTVLPAKGDSDVIFFTTVKLNINWSLHESVDHFCINPIPRITILQISN